MNIFECKEPMPPKDNSPDVVRTALTSAECRANQTPLYFSPDRKANSVVNVERPRYGHAS